MTKVLYPGSFDPITYGHMNIIEQASLLFDEVYVGIMVNHKKTPMFSLKERTNMLNRIYNGKDNIHIVTSEAASVDLAMKCGCNAILRGLRSLSDYEFEVSLAHLNRDLSDGKINTICLFVDNKYQYMSSTIVKEIDNLGKSLLPYVHPIVEEEMLLRRKRR